jgi:uncharacterized OsmC-like protein
VPVSFQNIQLHFELVTDASQEQLANLIRLTERYCVVYQTLQKSPAISWAHGVKADDVCEGFIIYI